MALKADLIHPRGGIDKDLLKQWQALQRLFSTGSVVCRDGTPACHLQSLSNELLLQTGTGLISQFGHLIQEHYTGGVVFCQMDTLLTSHCPHEPVRGLHQQAAAVTGLAIGSNSAAVGQPGQRIDGRLHQPVTGDAIHMGNETKTAAVLFKGGTIKAWSFVVV